MEFAREFLGVEVHPWQRELLESLERGDRRFIGAWRGGGKTGTLTEAVERMRFRLGPGGPTYRDRSVKRGPARVLPFRPKGSR